MTPTPHVAVMTPTPRAAVMGPNPHAAIMGPNPHAAIMGPNPHAAIMGMNVSLVSTDEHHVHIHRPTGPGCGSRRARAGLVVQVGQESMPSQAAKARRAS